MAETAGGNPRALSRPAWAWLILAWLVIAGSGALYAFSRLPSLHRPVGFRDVASLERFTRFRFPAGAQLLYSHILAGQDTTVLMKVALPPGTVAEFVRQRLLTQPEHQKRLLAGHEDSPDTPEWDPQKVRSFVNLEGKLWGQDAPGWGLISLDDPARPVLYLMWAN